jgi:hypothetical protein
VTVDGELDRYTDAIRILLLIAAVADPLSVADSATSPANAVAVLRSESRLQKLDFWLRNPDYLADELLNDYERSKEQVLLDLASGILENDEPEVRSIPMIRYLFGAFERLDRALSMLAAPRLVITMPRRTANGNVVQANYYLTSKGREVADTATASYPELAWYTERALLVRALAEATGHTGLALRRRQYLQRDYAETPLGEVIPPIADRTRGRLARLRMSATQGAMA